MKITDVKWEVFSWPRHSPITNGKHTYTNFSLSVCTIKTDEGVSGIGMITTKHPDLLEFFRDHLIGQDPLNHERLWHDMWVAKLVGRRGMTTRTISTIDMALWDIKGKVCSMPLYKLFGGYRTKLPYYIAGGYYMKDKGLKELAEEMIGFVNMGARAVKMKVGALSFKEDAARVKAVREAVGCDVKVLLDANCAYRYYEAIQFARMVEEYEPFWFEEPVHPDDYEGHKKLAAMTTIPLATGENEYTKYGFRDLINTGAVPILNLDATIMGGYTEFMKVAAMAQAYDIDIAPHGAQEAHIHLTAAIANALIVEYYPDSTNPMATKLFTNPLLPNDDGTISPPDRPGLGFELNYDMLDKHRVQ